MIGKLRERITFQQENDSADGGGGFTRGWVNIATTPIVWARVGTISGRELVQAEQLQSPVTHKITVRYRSDITTKMRIVWGSKNLNIRSVINPDEKQKFTEFLVEENVAL